MPAAIAAPGQLANWDGCEETLAALDAGQPGEEEIPNRRIWRLWAGLGRREAGDALCAALAGQ